MHGIYFTNNTCIKCGKIDCIKLHDTFSRPIDIKGFPSLFAKCINCGMEYTPVMDLESTEVVFRDRVLSIENFVDRYCK